MSECIILYFKVVQYIKIYIWWKSLVIRDLQIQVSTRILLFPNILPVLEFSRTGDVQK